MLKAEELNLEHVQLKNDHWILEQQLRHRDEELQKLRAMPTTAMPNLIEVRDRTLNKLKVGRQSAAGKAIDAFIRELKRESEDLRQ